MKDKEKYCSNMEKIENDKLQPINFAKGEKTG